MAHSRLRMAVFLTGLTVVSGIRAQNPRLAAIDPAGEHFRVYLSYLDAAAQQNFAGMFEIPLYRDYKPYSLLLTNASGKAIVALNIRWVTTSAGRSGVYDSSSDSLLSNSPGGGMGSAMRLSLPGPARPVQTTELLGQSHESADGPVVLANGERMLVAPGLFARESHGSPGGSSSLIDALQKAETVSATLDAVVLEDGEVLGPDASHTVDTLRARKAGIDTVVSAVRAAEQKGQDGVEALRQFVIAPHTSEGGPETMRLRIIARSLMASRDWKGQLEKLAAIRLPNFHR